MVVRHFCRELQSQDRREQVVLHRLAAEAQDVAIGLVFAGARVPGPAEQSFDQFDPGGFVEVEIVDREQLLVGRLCAIEVAPVKMM